MTSYSRFFLLSIFAAITMVAFTVHADTSSILRPFADGGEDSASWTNSSSVSCSGTNCYLEVDETSGGSCVSSDGDTSYITTGTNGATQTFDIDESSIPDGATITQIDITVCARRAQGGVQIQTRRCVDGSCTSSGSNIAPGTSYAESTQSHTGLSITKSGSTDLEIGVLNNASKISRVSQISAVVTYTPAVDGTAPSAISDLALSGATTSTIDLDWTAPGDDAGVGTATTYDIRYSTSAINDGNWASATVVTGEPSPSVAGSSESMTVNGLSENTTYYFAIKTTDEESNESSISNIPSLTTSVTPDTTAPSDISDLTLSNATASTIKLTWTSPGDDAGVGTADSYDVRYSTSAISSGNWASATTVTGEPTPSVAGSSDTMTITGLSSNTTYHFAIKTSDEVPNESSISNAPSLATTAVADTTAPSDTSDLDSSGVGSSSVTLTWTASGDDAGVGTADSYDVRYSTSAISDGNWASATTATGEPSPSAAGSSESFAVGGLSQGTQYYFALKTSDEAANESGLSNVYNTTTTSSSDTTAPSAISDLALSGATASAIDLDWTAPGDDAGVGTATTYDIRYSTSVINDGNWASATAVSSEPSPSVAGSSESMTITGLDASTEYYFAIKTLDEEANESDISNIPSLTTSEAAPTSSIELGSGGGSTARTFVFQGQAFPGSDIEILRRSSVEELYYHIPLENRQINEDGTFRITYAGLLGGNYFIALRVIDPSGRKTGIISFDANLINNDSLIVEDMLIPPTLGLLNAGIGVGEKLKLEGYAAGNILVKVYVDLELVGEVTSGDDGSWSFESSVAEFSNGVHQVSVSQTKDERESDLSFPSSFKISGNFLPAADFNKDKKIDIVDWSIFLSHWGDEDSENKLNVDLNGDDDVDILDFSLFLKEMTR